MDGTERDECKDNESLNEISMHDNNNEWNIGMNAISKCNILMNENNNINNCNPTNEIENIDIDNELKIGTYINEEIKTRNHIKNTVISNTKESQSKYCKNFNNKQNKSLKSYDFKIGLEVIKKNNRDYE